MRLAFFGYAWNRELQPDAYMAETIESLLRTGADVDLFLGSQLSKELGIYGLKEDISLTRLQAFIAQEGYDAAFSFNNSLLLPEIIGAVGGRTATIIVDEPEHFFDYRRQGPYAILHEDIEVVAMSTAVEQKIQAAVPAVKPRLHFMLPATHLDTAARGTKPLYPISWIASYVGDNNLDQYMHLMMDRPEYHALTVRCLDIVARHGNLKTVAAQNGADMALIKALPWTFEYFQTQIQNILTNRARVEVAERLTPHGLALFGNAEWHKLLTYNATLLKALRPGPAPSKHAELIAIYNASKISINLPQAHVASLAVQYRVIDVMGSNALMITKRDPNSDLYRVFGQDCPVPTYADIDELEAQCVHFLAHEDERRDIVQRCNALLEGFDFNDRAEQLLRIVGLEKRRGRGPGSQRRIDMRLFAKDA